jgi:hypothetical protein
MTARSLAWGRATPRVLVLVLSLLLLLTVLPATAGALPTEGPGDSNDAGDVHADDLPADALRAEDMGALQAAAGEAAPDFPTTDDPRVGLAAGAGEAAGQAIRNLEKLASVPKVAPLTNTNSDLAFTGDHVLSGNYTGINVYDVTDPADPVLTTQIICPGGQNDVSVYGDLMFVSVEVTNAKDDCTTGGVTTANRFRGIRIFDISDVENPVRLPGVQTCRGSHTHTVVADPNDADNVYIYNSSMAGIRSGAELAGCNGNSSLTDPTTANFRIDVIKVPLAAPETAAVVSNPRIFSTCGSSACIDDYPSGALNALSRPGVQPRYADDDPRAPGGQSVAQTVACHDITAYPEIGLAAGACQGDGLLLDITDPVNPVRIDNVVDYNFAYWHSATFNNDGTKVIFTDEWGGGGGARCRATDPLNWGANALFDIVDTADGKKMEFASYFKLPMVQTNQENCVAHNGSLIPVPGRDLMVQAWYQGGTTVFDFTDSANPVEIAYFDRGPISATSLVSGGFWSTYWHNGYMYGNEIARGFDVFDLTASEHLNAVEIAAAKQVTFDEYNVQHQERLVWPATFTTARAWHSAAQRAGVLGADVDANLTRFIDRAEAHNADGNAAQRNSAAANLRAVGNQLGGSTVEQGLQGALLELADVVGRR